MRSERNPVGGGTPRGAGAIVRANHEFLQGKRETLGGHPHDSNPALQLARRSTMQVPGLTPLPRRSRPSQGPGRSLRRGCRPLATCCLHQVGARHASLAADGALSLPLHPRQVFAVSMVQSFQAPELPIGTHDWPRSTFGDRAPPRLSPLTWAPLRVWLGWRCDSKQAIQAGFHH